LCSRKQTPPPPQKNESPDRTGMQMANQNQPLLTCSLNSTYLNHNELAHSILQLCISDYSIKQLYKEKPCSKKLTSFLFQLKKFPRESPCMQIKLSRTVHFRTKAIWRPIYHSRLNLRTHTEFPVSTIINSGIIFRVKYDRSYHR
jgi:hypothetical protein